MTDTPASIRLDASTRLLSPLRAARAIGPEALAYAVHGLVLFVAVVGATFVADYPAWQMLIYSAGAVLLFWCAHVYSAVLADQHTPQATVPTGITLVWHEMKRHTPLLEACIAPAVPLILAVTGVLPSPMAYAASLTIGLVTLAVVGFLSLRNRRGSLRRSLFAAVTTAGFGAGIIAAETFLH
ncbi:MULTISPECIES: hypothetical protein [unclassified Microbacterium]|uniref:hypothetical protein n=1 Tax=unclassified Microbacterium TaxID=2609290 RepID=UPI00214D00C5|nr:MULTISPECIES: hypothetical protein [unclassified Microbacterium]MCR2783513.1 hypothetical protein [Microbacterium sp. zg.B96]MDL5351699.1 hypothetical protein [Microbacterium sp. zg-YB36]WIM15625.1 hypothetical protein QNO11_13955 [Microbacterium sp. zg-B96]